jgi:quinol monooxygenase YgiN
VRPECEARFLEILAAVTARVEVEEPDCLVYATWATAEPQVYLMVESYRSEAGRELHNRLHGAIAPEFFSLLAEPPGVERLGALVSGHPS